MARKKINYIDKEELLQEVIKSKANNNTATDKLAKMFILMTRHYISKGSFAGYTLNYKIEFESLALYTLCRGWHKFDTDRKDAFSYYTSCIHNAILQVLNKEKKSRNLRDKLIKEQGLEASFEYEDYGED